MTWASAGGGKFSFRCITRSRSPPYSARLPLLLPRPRLEAGKTLLNAATISFLRNVKMPAMLAVDGPGETGKALLNAAAIIVLRRVEMTCQLSQVGPSGPEAKLSLLKSVRRPVVNDGVSCSKDGCSQLPANAGVRCERDAACAKKLRCASARVVSLLFFTLAVRAPPIH